MDNFDIENRRKELEEVIRNAKAELSELEHKSFARLLKEDMLTAIRRGEAIEFNFSTEWNYLRHLAISLHRKKKDSWGLTEHKYKKIRDMSTEDFKLSLSFLDEVIPIWNKYFLKANKDLINEAEK